MMFVLSCAAQVSESRHQHSPTGDSAHGDAAQVSSYGKTESLVSLDEPTDAVVNCLIPPRHLGPAG
jgi:hypothetical protein